VLRVLWANAKIIEGVRAETRYLGFSNCSG
jgi:hypothetical protein